MSLKLLAAEHVVTHAQNEDHFAESVTRKREGHRQSTSVVCLVRWDGPEIRDTETRDAKIKGYIELATDSTLAMSDLWTVNGHTYCTKAISEPEYGMQTVSIEARQPDLRSSSLGRI